MSTALAKVGFSTRTRNAKFLHASPACKIEQKAGEPQVTALCFDPRRVRIFPLFTEELEREKQHVRLNPGICFRNLKTLPDYEKDFRAQFPQANLIAMTNGNNLFAHPFDILLRTIAGKVQFYTSHENPNGPRTCLAFHPDGTIKLITVEIKDGLPLYPAGIEHALYGQHIVEGGVPVKILESGLTPSFSGNYTHLFNFPRFFTLETESNPHQPLIVEKAVLLGHNLGCHQLAEDSSLAEKALRGESITLKFPNYGLIRPRGEAGKPPPPTVGQDEIDAAREYGSALEGKFTTQKITEAHVKDALSRSGYNNAVIHLREHEITFPTGLKRSHYPHTAMGFSTEGAGIVATFDGKPHVSGPTVEEVAETMSLLGAQEAVLLGNGSEVLMSTPAQGIINSPASSVFKSGITANAIAYFLQE
jgi:hypothetical protein